MSLNNSKQLIGVFLVIVSAIAIAIVPTSAKFAYESGANTLTVVSVRAIIAVMLMAIIIAYNQEKIKIPLTTLKLCIFSGLFYTAMSYGFIGSLSYIPVSLMVVIYFTHPVLLAIISHVQGNEKLDLRKLVLILAVFVGLSLVLAPTIYNLNWIGCALALLAAVSVCGMILFNSRAQQHASTISINFYMTMTTVFIFFIFTSVQNSWEFPQQLSGWIGLSGAGVGLTIGLITFFAAFRYIGAVRATVISNIEPLLTIIFAVLLLNETLTLSQWIGATLMALSLVLFELPNFTVFKKVSSSH